MGIAVPDPEYCVQWGKSHGFLPADMPPGVTPPPPGQPPHPGILKLCSLPEFKNAVLADMGKIGKVDKLRGYELLTHSHRFEFVRAIHLEPVFFSVDNGLLTPTFKLKRNEASEKYRSVIDGLYRELEGSKSPKSKL